MSKLGFHEIWINWIRECITSVSFSVLVNGTPTDQLFPSRGIRQGDPLSPYLFILCAELLTRNLSYHSINGHKLIGVTPGHSRMKIPFLTFADDTMIFAKASSQSCTIIKNILDKYFKMSGQLVNFNKSAFQCTKNVSQIERDDFKRILQMEESSSLGNYLGCPIIDSRVTNETFSSILTSTQNQLTKWKANSLSQAGRTVLIQSNLASKANYQMQSFTLPSTLNSKLDKVYRQFFWNRDTFSKAPNLISWDRICKPKCLGGLGFRKAEVNNKAMQLKLLWRIITYPSNFWVQLV